MEPQLTASERDQLNVLGILFYVYAGLQVLTGLAGGVYVLMGGLMLNDPTFHSSGAPPVVEALPWFFIAVGMLVTLYIWSVAVLLFFTASSIRARKRHVLCCIGSAFILLNIPLGTALGVFALILLLRPSVKSVFERPEAFPQHNAPYPPTI